MSAAANFWRSSMVLTVANLFVSAGNYIFQAIMGRSLPLAEFGYLNATLALVGMLAIALTAAGQAVTHHLARHQAADRAADVDRLKAASSSFLFYLTIGCSLLALVVIQPVTQFFGVPRTTLTMVALGSILVNMWGALAIAWCAGLSRFGLLAGLTLGSVAVRLLAGGLGSQTWPSAEVGVGASIVAGLVVVIGVAWKGGGMPRPNRANLGPMWEPAFIAYLIAAVAICGGQYLFLHGDLVVAQRHLDADTLGAYSAAGLFGRAVVWLPLPVLTVFFTARSGRDRSDRATFKLLALFALLLVVGAGGVLATKDFLCRLLLGRAEPAAIELMARFAVAMVPIGLLQGAGFYLLSARKLAACFVYGALGLAYWATLTWWGQDADLLLRLMFIGASAGVGVMAVVALAARSRAARI